MANSDDSSWGSAFVKGAFALIGALVLFVVEQYIQHRYWPDNPPSASSGKDSGPVSTIIPIDGRIVDALGTKVIENAVVDITINGLHEDQNTDSDGRYAFSLEGFDPNTAASMTVKADGYKEATENLLLSAMEEEKELKLEALAVVPGNGGGPKMGAPGSHAPAATVRPLSRIKYVKRIDPKVLIAHH